MNLLAQHICRTGMVRAEARRRGGLLIPAGHAPSAGLPDFQQCAQLFERTGDRGFVVAAIHFRDQRDHHFLIMIGRRAEILPDRQRRAGRIPAGDPEAAVAAGIISREEAALLREAAEARQDAIEVDSFTLEEYLGIPETSPTARMAATA